MASGAQAVVAGAQAVFAVAQHRFDAHLRPVAAYLPRTPAETVRARGTHGCARTARTAPRDPPYSPAFTDEIADGADGTRPGASAVAAAPGPVADPVGPFAGRIYVGVDRTTVRGGCGDWAGVTWAVPVRNSWGLMPRTRLKAVERAKAEL